MTTDEVSKPIKKMRIVIIENGPYFVKGGVPLVTKTQVASEHGEPLTWQKTGDIPVSEGGYLLCRCGQSSNKPFCDDTHLKMGFDGAETADAGVSERRALKLPGGAHLIVKKDASLCMLSGFCGLRNAAIEQFVADSKDSKARSIAIGMVERCPSGSLTYRIEASEPDIEPDLPPQIAVTTEITSDGPIAGPLWVTGGIPVERSDGQPFETRNRVTLCNCGHSSNKPLCDGTHRANARLEAKRRRAGG
jgi:CDGSH-type Zn-finger protein